MNKLLVLSLFTAVIPAAAHAQSGAPALAPAMGGVRLEVAATGEVARTPDLVTISAGVTTRAVQAEAALRENAARMESVRAALRRAGIAPRDMQTGFISLSQDYRPDREGRGEMQPAGYVASNQLTIKFRDVARAGAIIDALVSAGANNVNGPSFEVENREAALDEARVRALAAARERAEIYARALGTRVRRIVAISETSGFDRIVPTAMARMEAASADTVIQPGQQAIATTVNVMFELDQPNR